MAHSQMIHPLDIAISLAMYPSRPAASRGQRLAGHPWRQSAVGDGAATARPGEGGQIQVRRANHLGD